MKSLAFNLLNGNLTTARKQARNKSHMKIIDGLVEHLGYGYRKAHLGACYLKSGNNFQAFCDCPDNKNLPDFID